MWPETLPAGCFAKRLKFPQNSPPCSVPCQFHRTLSHSPHLHRRPPPIIPRELPSATSWGKGLSLRWHKPYYLQLSHFLQPPFCLAICSCYLLSLAIWRYLPTWQSLSVPCLQLSCLQTQIVLTRPLTFKATTLCPFHFQHDSRLSRQKLFRSKAVLMTALVITKAAKILLVCPPPHP